MTAEEMLGQLELEIEHDARKMFRWRQVHRAVACAVTLTLIALPVLATMKELEGREHYFLFGLTIIAAYEGLFRPAVHSARRRTDAADMTDLLWELRSALLATSANDWAQRLAIHDRFRQRYKALFRARGEYLVDFSLARRENDLATGGAAGPAGRAAREADNPGDAAAAAASNTNERRAIEPLAAVEGALRHA